MFASFYFLDENFSDVQVLLDALIAIEDTDMAELSKMKFLICADVDAVSGCVLHGYATLVFKEYTLTFIVGRIALEEKGRYGKRVHSETSEEELEPNSPQM